MYLLEPVLEPDELQCAILVENVLITEEVQLQQQTTGTRRQRESKKDLFFFFFFLERNMFRPEWVGYPLNKLLPGRHQATVTGQLLSA